MRKIAATCCAAFLALFGTALAGDIPPSPIVKTEFSIHAPAVNAGEVIWAGVTYTIPEGWHIYWQNPGDSGISTTMEWKLPQEITAGDILWPVPQRIEEQGLVTYGYSGHVTLPVPLTPSQAAKGTISVTTRWLVCKDSCIPESATFSAMLPVTNPAAAQVLEAAVMQAPQSVLDAKVEYATVGDTVLLGIAGPDILPPGAPPVTHASFFPLDDGIIDNASAQNFKLNPDGSSLTLTLKRGALPLLERWRGVLSLTRGGEVQHYAITARLDPRTAPAMPAALAKPSASVTLLAALALAFLGGLILNAMPCVLPILALKALALAKKAEASRAIAAQQGVAYTLGVVLSFLLIAAGMLILRASGAAIGWGFQLQHSGGVAFLMLVMLLVSANLLGLFEVPVLFGSRTATNDTRRDGAFLTGILAVLVATPCTAPFMATAIGATLAMPMVEALLVFSALGLGMASPFLLISLWPAARRLLPRPGKWMQRVKQVLALPMLATAAWLAWVLVQLNTGSVTPMDAAHVAYSPVALQQLRDEGKPVLVDATAAWCLSCKVNERVALSPEAMQDFFHAHGVTIMVADWTSSDPKITEYLAGFGRNGVPLYVYYPPRAQPVVLPQILTPSLVRDAITGNHE